MPNVNKGNIFSFLSMIDFFTWFAKAPNNNNKYFVQGRSRCSYTGGFLKPPNRKLTKL